MEVTRRPSGAESLFDMERLSRKFNKHFFAADCFCIDDQDQDPETVEPPCETTEPEVAVVRSVAGRGITSGPTEVGPIAHLRTQQTRRLLSLPPPKPERTTTLDFEVLLGPNGQNHSSSAEESYSFRRFWRIKFATRKRRSIRGEI